MTAVSNTREALRPWVGGLSGCIRKWNGGRAVKEGSQRKDTQVGWRLEKPPEDESWVEICEGGQSWMGWWQAWQRL